MAQQRKDKPFMPATYAPCQQLVDQAAAGSVLTLEAGEFHGPIYIDKPLTIQGKGEHTALWVQQGPSMVVLAPDVQLSQLWLEQTIPSGNRPDILYLEGCPPTLDLPSSNKVVSESMNQERLIDLDTLGAGEQIAVTLELPLNASWDFMDLENLPYGQILPMPSNQYDTMGGILTLQVPQDQGYLYTKLILADSQTNTRAYYLIKGRVKSLPTHESTVLESNSGQLVYFGRYLDLNRRTVFYMSGGQLDINQRFAMIVPSNAQNGRALWVPSEDCQPPVYNDHVLRPWTRRALNADDEIRLDQLKLTVRHNKQRGPLNINPFECNFHTVSDPTTASLSLTIAKRSAKVPWTGKIRSLVPWIKITQVELADAAQQTVTIELDRNAFYQLENGVHQEASAIVIYDKQAVYFLAARIEVETPEYDLNLIAPVEFQAQPDAPFYAESLAGHPSSFILENRGRAAIQCQIIKCVDWLNVDDSQFIIQPNSRYELSVTLGSLANTFGTGDVDERTAITVLGVESNTQITIPAFIGGIQPPLTPVIKARIYGEDRHQFNKYRPQEIEARILLTNEGNAPGVYTIHAEGDLRYVDIANASGTIDPGDEINAYVRVAAQALMQLPEDQIAQVDLIVETGKANQPPQRFHWSFQIEVVDWSPELDVEPDEIYVAIVERLPHEEDIDILVENSGRFPYDGKIALAVPWLALRGSAERAIPLYLDSGQAQTIHLTLTDAITQYPVGMHPFESALEFILFDGAKARSIGRLDAYLDVKPRRPDPHVLVDPLWFESLLIGDTSQKMPVDKLKIGNFGHGDWQAEISHMADWLELPIASYRLVIPGNSVLRLPITVNERVFYLPPGPHIEPHAIRLRGADGRELTVSARILLQPRTPNVVLDKTQLNLGEVLVGQQAELSNTFTLINHGTLDWRIVNTRVPSRLTLNHAPRVPAGGNSIVCTVRLRAETPVMQPGPYSDVITLHGDDGKQFDITVNYTVGAPMLTMSPVNPERLEIRTRRSATIFEGHQSSTIPPAILLITNHTNGHFRMVFDSLDGNQLHFFMPPEVDVTVNNPEIFGLHSSVLPAMIDFGPHQTLELAVRKRSTVGHIQGMLREPFVLNVPYNDIQECDVVIL